MPDSSAFRRSSSNAFAVMATIGISPRFPGSAPVSYTHLDVYKRQEVAKVTEFSAVKTMEEDDARAEGLFQVIGTDFDDRYVAKLKEQSIHPEIIKDAAKDMKIVYTPLHGTGNVPVRRVLRELGFNQVYVVKEQKVPDGNFPTCLLYTSLAGL